MSEKSEYLSAGSTPSGIAAPVELREGVLACGFCGNAQFRRSKVRAADLLEILRLRYPLRCTRCGQRQYHDAALAFLSAPVRARGSRISEGVDTWQDWTRSTPETPLSTRPMSTAVGTRAQRLPNAGTAPATPAPATRVQGRRSGDSEIW